MEVTKENGRVPFEIALNMTGFGPYNYVHTVLTGVMIISYAFILFNSPMLVPTSACELQTTVAQQGVLAATPMVGSVFGALFWGYLGDTRGRRNMLVASLLSSAASNALASLSVNWVMLMIVIFFSAVLSSGVFPLAMAILSESVPFAKRNVTILAVASIFLTAQGFMAVLAIPTIGLSFSYHVPVLSIQWNSWRLLTVLYSIPSILSALWLLFYLKESPKFVFTKGDVAGALEILRYIHRKNHRNSTEEYNVKEILFDPAMFAKKPARDQIVPLFKPPLLKYTIIMSTLMIFDSTGSFMMWLPTVANRFMYAFQTGEGHDLTLCRISNMEIVSSVNEVPCSLNTMAMLLVFAVGAMQSFGNGLIALIVNRTGRRNSVIALMTFFGISGILVNLVPNAVISAMLFAFFLLGYLTTGLYTAMGVALFPTQLRAMSMSLIMTVGRLGTFGFVQILNYLLVTNCELGFYLFASILASSAIVAGFLPDDRLLSKKEISKKPDDLDMSSTETIVVKL